jgi:hypothetical protein
MLKLNSNKRGVIELSSWIYLILYTFVFGAVCVSIVFTVDSIIDARIRTYNLPYHMLDMRLLNSMSFESDMTYIGMIDPNKFSGLELSKMIDREHFPNQYDFKIGIKLVLNDLDRNEKETIYYDEEFYEDATPIARLKYSWVKNVHPVQIYSYEGKPRPGVLEVEVIGRPT